MTREEKKKEKLEKEKQFKLNEFQYCKECFDVDSEYYCEMILILNNAKNRKLFKEIGYELHHKIPKSYFRKKNMKIIDEGNLYKLTYSEHFMVHYYAYRCATKFMKNCMALSLLQMKRVCTKNNGCDDYNAENLSKLFEDVKIEIYSEKNKKCLQESILFWNQRLKNKSYNFILLKRIKQQDQIWNIKCLNCDFEFTRNLHSFLKTDMNCPECGYSEYCNGLKFKSISYYQDVDVLWFGIDYRYDSAVWGISSVSYTPNMMNRKVRLNRLSSAVRNSLPVSNYIIKCSVIDVKPKGYKWMLDEKRKFTNRYDDFIFLNYDNDSFEICDKRNKNLNQKINRLVRLNKGVKIPRYIFDYFMTNFNKDFEKRFLEIVHKMQEINNFKDVKDFNK